MSKDELIIALKKAIYDCNQGLLEAEGIGILHYCYTNESAEVIDGVLAGFRDEQG